MAKHDEWVMAVERAGLFGCGYFQGMQAKGCGAWFDYIFEPRNSRFLPRSEAERDPEWKQVIPYVVLACGEEVYCYARGQGSTEARLRAQRSLGLGGHIRPTDESMFAAPGREAYEAGLERELGEEVEIGATVEAKHLVGLINDDSTEVGRVHVGLVHVWWLAEAKVRAREAKIAGGGFRPIAELRREVEGFETWSQLVFKDWEQIAAHNG